MATCYVRGNIYCYLGLFLSLLDYGIHQWSATPRPPIMYLEAYEVRAVCKQGDMQQLREKLTSAEKTAKTEAQLKVHFIFYSSL